jgi:predicted phage terminase large subunit-like protein
MSETETTQPVFRVRDKHKVRQRIWRKEIRQPKTAPIVPAEEIENPSYRNLPEQNEKTKKYISVVHAEEWWIEQARVNPLAFYEYVSGYTAARHHRIWLANVFHPERKRINIIAPRESAKTTCLTYAMCWYIGRFPLSTNAIVSVSSAQAEDRMRMVKGTIEDMDRFHNVFPYLKLDTKNGVPNTQQQFTVKMTDVPYKTWRISVATQGSPKDPTIVVAGRGSKSFIGRRFSGLVILDDFVDESDLSDMLQDKAYRYLMQTIIPSVKESGRVVNIGTRWMVDDVAERLKKNPSWHTIEIQALRRDPSTGQLMSYWPEYWSVEDLLKRKAEMNNDALFNIMYMNDPSSAANSLFTDSGLRSDIPRPLPAFKRLMISTDQAMTSRTRSDFSVYMLIGQDSMDNYYVLEMERFKADPDHQVKRLAAFYDRCLQLYPSLSGILFEDIGSQSLLMHLLRKERGDIPCYPYRPKGDKGTRASLVSRYSRAGKLFINQQLPDIDVLRSEWINFPLAKHDDTLDPVGLFIQSGSQSMTVKQTRYIQSRYLL